MSTLLRIWAVIATLGALLLGLRGAWMAAIAVFLLSPAPAWFYRASAAGELRLPIAWLALIGGACVAAVTVMVTITYFGGIPQVHEWRAALQKP